MYRADAENLKVKTDDGKHLFTYDPATRTIEINQRGHRFLIPLWLIEEHLRTSQRSLITVYAEPDDKDTFPCGHKWVLDAYLNQVCPVCDN
jgi:hypothetical protein